MLLFLLCALLLSAYTYNGCVWTERAPSAKSAVSIAVVNYAVITDAVIANPVVNHAVVNNADLTAAAQQDSAVIAFISDTQAPIWLEKLRLKSDDNENATGAIFSAISKENGVKALFHLGDITPMGSLEHNWNEMNVYFRKMKHADIPVYPAMGNHEYMLLPGRGRSLFFRYFPYLNSSWYVRTIGRTAVIILNSNFSHLDDHEISSQQKWLNETIKRLDSDTAIDAVIMAAHHSPYTNSTIVSPSEDVQKHFVPAYLKSRKARLFISGHAHAFEHFSMHGKDFLVIGGGGGLLQPLRMGSKRRYNDLSPVKTERRMFHYIICEQRQGRLHIRVKMINPGYKSFNTVYEFSI